MPILRYSSIVVVVASSSHSTKCKQLEESSQGEILNFFVWLNYVFGVAAGYWVRMRFGEPISGKCRGWMVGLCDFQCVSRSSHWQISSNMCACVVCVVCAVCVIHAHIGHCMFRAPLLTPLIQQKAKLCVPLEICVWVLSLLSIFRTASFAANAICNAHIAHIRQ